MRTVFIITMAIFLVSCGSESQRQEGEATTVLIAPPTTRLGVVTLEREIILSDAIIRGTLNTVEASVINDAEGKYRPSVAFNFTSLETLKGTYTAGTISGIWVGAYSYNTRDEAIARSKQRIAERDTQWDSREAIFFLNRRQYPDLDENALDTPSQYILAKALVVQHVCIEGYSDLSLMRASSVVKRQFTRTASRLRLFCHASTSPRRVSLSGMRRSRHCRASTPISISAIFSQLPCLGV